MTGHLSPLVAAMLMPASSLTVVFASWRGRTFPEKRNERSLHRRAARLGRRRGIAVGAFAWAARRGQFDDLETPAIRMLHDDDERCEPLIARCREETVGRKKRTRLTDFLTPVAVARAYRRTKPMEAANASDTPLMLAVCYDSASFGRRQARRRRCRRWCGRWKGTADIVVDWTKARDPPRRARDCRRRSRDRKDRRRNDRERPVPTESRLARARASRQDRLDDRRPARGTDHRSGERSCVRS